MAHGDRYFWLDVSGPAALNGALGWWHTVHVREIESAARARLGTGASAKDGESGVPRAALVVPRLGVGPDRCTAGTRGYRPVRPHLLGRQLVGYIVALVTLIAACRAPDQISEMRHPGIAVSGGIGLTRSEARDLLEPGTVRSPASNDGDRFVSARQMIWMQHVWAQEVSQDIVSFVSITPSVPLSVTDARAVVLAYLPSDAILLSRAEPVVSAARDGVERYLSGSLSKRLGRSGREPGTLILVTYQPVPGGISEIRIVAHP